MAKEPPNVDQILKDLQAEHGGKIVLSESLIRKVGEHLRRHPEGNLRGGCAHGDQVCVLCDVGQDICKICDVTDLCLTAPDI
jgi:hypothetical protein